MKSYQKYKVEDRALVTSAMRGKIISPGVVIQHTLNNLVHSEKSEQEIFPVAVPLRKVVYITGGKVGPNLSRYFLSYENNTDDYVLMFVEIPGISLPYGNFFNKEISKEEFEDSLIPIYVKKEHIKEIPEIGSIVLVKYEDPSDPLTAEYNGLPSKDISDGFYNTYQKPTSAQSSFPSGAPTGDAT